MKRALLITTQGIGNVVLMTPVIRMLADAGNQIDVIISDNSADEILSANRYIDQRFLWIERDGWLRNVVRLGSKLQSMKYDSAYALYPNGKRENSLLFLSRASHKKCYVDPKYYYRLLGFLPFIEKIVIEKHHDVISNIRLLETNGRYSKLPEPEIPISEISEMVAERFFEQHHLKGQFVVAVQPGGGNSAKQWGEKNYFELCLKLARDRKIKFLLFGSSGEADLVNRIASQLENAAIPVCGLNINHVCALLRRSQLVIANDSALIHLASAFKIPVVAIWGYTDFQRTAPFNCKGILIRIDYPCSPCYHFATGYINDCRYHLKCIRNLSAERVYKIVDRYISLLSSHQSFDDRLFGNDEGVESIKRTESGCLMVNVLAS